MQFPTGPGLVRLGAAAALVIVLRSRQRSNVRNACEHAILPRTPTTEAPSCSPATRRLALLGTAATAIVLRWCSAPGMLRLILTLLLLLVSLQLFVQARNEHCGRQKFLTVHFSQADGEPTITVSRRGNMTHVSAAVAVASSSRQLWSIVRECLNGSSHGVLRDVKHSEVLDRPSRDVCMLAQRVTWRAGVLRGENQLHARVHTNDAERSLTFTQVSDDPILKAYSGRLSVHTTGASTSVLEMQQVAEGHSSVLAHLAGSTVLGSTLRSQTRGMLQDFKRAAEARS